MGVTAKAASLHLDTFQGFVHVKAVTAILACKVHSSLSLS